MIHADVSCLPNKYPEWGTTVSLQQTLVATAVDSDYSEAVKKYFLKRFALNMNLAL